MMGAAAAGLADLAIFTNDNPRSEDPLGILAEMLAGALTVPARDRAHVIIEPDRGAAIGLAISAAGKGDVVLVAGKGHERGQYSGTSVIPFDDREVAAEALARRLPAESSGGPAPRASLAPGGPAAGRPDSAAAP
jgi:UDP-N-acetylmuramoyl-L-alanyl-D-glutamate--2,6-diaminopimelate ligase